MTATDTLTDATLRHNIQVARYARGQQQLAIRIVEQEAADLRARLAVDLEGIQRRGPSAMPWARAQWRVMQDRIDSGAQAIADSLRERLDANMRAMAKQEADWSMRAASKAGADLTPLDKRTVGSIAGEPMAGRTLKEWTQSIGDALARRLKTELSVGLRQGETDSQLQGRMRKAIEEAQRNAAAVAATGMRHVQAQILQRIAEANS